jgi:hypothetical protein
MSGLAVGRCYRWVGGKENQIHEETYCKKKKKRGSGAICYEKKSHQKLRVFHQSIKYIYYRLTQLIILYIVTYMGDYFQSTKTIFRPFTKSLEQIVYNTLTL